MCIPMCACVCMCMRFCVCVHASVCLEVAQALLCNYLLQLFKKNCQLHCIRLGYFFFMGASVSIFKFQLRLFRRAFTVKNKPTTALLLFFNLWLEIHTADASSTVS